MMVFLCSKQVSTFLRLVTAPQGLYFQGFMLECSERLWGRGFFLHGPLSVFFFTFTHSPLTLLLSTTNHQDEVMMGARRGGS